MKKIMGLGALLMLLNGCASIVSESSYPVMISSSEPGTRYTVRNMKKGYDVASGVAPSTVSLPASNGFFSRAMYMVTFEKEGANVGMVPLKAGLDGWYFGNLLFGGLLGMVIIDQATGAMWKLDEQIQAPFNAAPVAYY